ncbi:MAG: chromosome condensation protein, partial [Pirellulales bacterium]
MLFPLPLTALEHYYWCDNHHEYPTTFPFKLLFNGKLQRGPLETAWTKALERHPMLQAGIDVSKGRPIWVETAGPFPELQWSESA